MCEGQHTDLHTHFVWETTHRSTHTIFVKLLTVIIHPNEQVNHEAVFTDNLIFDGEKDANKMPIFAQSFMYGLEFESYFAATLALE